MTPLNQTEKVELISFSAATILTVLDRTTAGESLQNYMTAFYVTALFSSIVDGIQEYNKGEDPTEVIKGFTLKMFGGVAIAWAAHNPDLTGQIIQEGVQSISEKLQSLKATQPTGTVPELPNVTIPEAPSIQVDPAIQEFLNKVLEIVFKGTGMVLSIGAVGLGALKASHEFSKKFELQSPLVIRPPVRRRAHED